MFTAEDHLYMSQALQLAMQGLYTTHPNPRVGCVIVKDGKVIGRGAHLKAGEPHAEIYALREAGDQAKGADAYVTLEPCSHYGRTPPCANGLIKAGIKRVIVAMQDPNGLVAGNGLEALQNAGIKVLTGLMEKEAKALNPGFISLMTRNRPFVRSKIAASLDGKTALNNGKSQWITGSAAREDVQHWRAQAAAILTGIGTVIADNPALTVRLDGALRQPLRVIVDSNLQTPLSCNLLDPTMLTRSPVLIAYAHDHAQKADALKARGIDILQVPDELGQVDLKALMHELAKRNIGEILVEAGQGLNGALLDLHLIDEFIFYYAPKLMGGSAISMLAIETLTQMDQAIDLQLLDVRQVGQDIRVRAIPVIDI